MSTTVTFRMDKNLKEEMQLLLNDFGMDMTTAFNVFAKAVVRQRKIPFEISANDGFYSPANQAVLEESLKQLRDGKGLKKELINE